MEATRAPSSGAQGASEHPLLRLQRQIGNRATVAYVSGRVVQRAPTTVDYEEEEGVDKTVDSTAFLGGQVTNWSSMGTIATGAYLTGNANNSTAGGSITGALLSAGTDLYDIVGGGMQGSEGLKTLKKERKAGRGKEATARSGKRDAKSGITDSVQSGGDLVSQGFTVTSQIATLVTNAGVHSAFAHAGNLVGGIGGIIALPFQALGTLRTGRKAAKQYKRFRKLRENVEDPKTSASKATKALEKQQEALQALVVTKQDAVEELGEARRQFSEARREAFARSKSKKSSKGPRLEKYRQLVTARQELVTDLETMIEEARKELANAHATKAEMQEALKQYEERAGRGEESAADIKAYAMRKNKSGVIKKLVGTVSGMIGIGGGVAATIAAFATAGIGLGSVAIATPVGWALCGVAAVAGLALAGYAFWKWASKRYDRLVKTGGADKGFKTWVKAMNPFYKKIPDSHRQHMATRLYDIAVRPQTDQETVDARNVIADLGLKWESLKMKDHREASIKLIYAKMAS